MTVQEMIEDIYALSGDNTEFEIYDAAGDFDFTSVGAQKILGLLNRAYDRICSWKMNDGTRIRFRTLRHEVFLRTASVTADVVSTDGRDVTVSGLVATVGKYVGWVVEYGQQRRLITGWNGSVLSLAEAFDPQPTASTELTLYKNFFPFVITSDHDGEAMPVAAGDVVAIQRVEDLTTKRLIARSSRVDSNISSLLMRSHPNLYEHRGSALYFNTSPPADMVYLVTYHGRREELIAVDQEPAIPSAWHECLVLWAVWWILKRMFQWDGAYATRRDLESVIQNLQQESENAWDLEGAAIESQEVW